MFKSQLKIIRHYRFLVFFLSFAETKKLTNLISHNMFITTHHTTIETADVLFLSYY